MDAGFRDAYGYVYVTARDDDVINVSGHRLSTSALEDVVMAHPDVIDCAVVGVPEPTRGEVPLCLFIMRQGESGGRHSGDVLGALRARQTRPDRQEQHLVLNPQRKETGPFKITKLLDCNPHAALAPCRIPEEGV